jgi:hypothetical protein
MVACGGNGASGTAATSGSGGGKTTSASASTAAGTTGSGGATTASAGSGGTTSASSGTGGGAPEGESVLQRNKHATRDGHYVQPLLTLTAAAKMAVDPSFNVTAVQGHVYAQPLYVENGPGGKGTFYVATEDDNVTAVSELDGSMVWTKSMGTAAGASGAGCGNIQPLGITGTPYIDLPSRTMFLDASIGTASTVQKHMIHALSIDDGTEMAGFPFDTSTLSAAGTTFNPALQNERGAVIVVNGVIYVPYGGHAGDCGQYRGWVIGVPIANPSGAKAFATAVRGGGIWAPGGLASDGVDVFATTGNTFGASTWSQGEAILRMKAGPVYSGLPADFFTPSNWQPLDAGDIDLGGSGPVLVDVPGATPSKLVVALGKNGVAYLLDRSNLGGTGTGNGTTGEGVASAKVASNAIINAAASYPNAAGAVVVFRTNNGGSGTSCPAGMSGDLVAIQITAAAPPTISTLWCVSAHGQGSPIVTTTDGTGSPVVWIAGSEGSQQLYGYDGATGATVFGGGAASDKLPNKIRRFLSPIAVKGRIVVAADSALYAFKSQ